MVHAQHADGEPCPCATLIAVLTAIGCVLDFFSFAMCCSPDVELHGRPNSVLCFMCCDDVTSAVCSQFTSSQTDSSLCCPVFGTPADV